ncbi:MAG: Rrf2 family transcriptional regulator [Deltaproteobacteria bacterium]|nr:Rrf2 family transcriptional regulator [Deltaproteobacteria bacterium]
MFRLSKAAEYAMRGVLHLSMKKEGSVSFIEAVAEAEDAPKAFLAKIFQTLAKKGFLKSIRGQKGGFVLVKDPKTLTPLEVIEAMEGPLKLNDCLISDGYCERDKVCPVHDVWKEAQEKFLGVLTDMTFAELADKGRQKRKKAGLSLVSSA